MSRFKLATMCVAGVVTLLIGRAGRSSLQHIDALLILAGLWLLYQAFKASRDGQTRVPSQKRFALSTLLLFVTATALLLGYAQWRRQWLTEEMRRLNTDGKSVISAHISIGFGSRTPATLALDSSFWPRVVDQSLRLLVFKNQRGEYHFEGEEPRPVEEMKQLLSSLKSRLQSVGITRVDCALVFPRRKDGSQRLKHFRIESLGTELDKRD